MGTHPTQHTLTQVLHPCFTNLPPNKLKDSKSQPPFHTPYILDPMIVCSTFLTQPFRPACPPLEKLSLRNINSLANYNKTFSSYTAHIKLSLRMMSSSIKLKIISGR